MWLRPEKNLLLSGSVVHFGAGTLVSTLRSLLAQQPHRKIYEVANGKVALDRIREIRPNVVVLDIVMPEMNGMEALSQDFLNQQPLHSRGSGDPRPLVR